MMTITRVGPLSLAKIAGLLGVVIGLIAGGLFSLVAMAGAAFGAGSGENEGAVFGALFGVGAIILLPIFYGCMAFVMTLIQAALFNVAARIVGGVEIEAR
jgi:hypothetical protein